MNPAQLLLDTCTVIWSTGDPDSLSAAAKSVMKSTDSRILVSAVSCAEIACAVEKRRIVIQGHWKPWFRKQVAINDWTVLPIDLDILEEAYSLPGQLHSDPADRILIATARIHGLTLVTGDQKILDYPHVKALW